MNVTMELIELQTYTLSKEESIINDLGQYKTTDEVFEILSKIWNTIDEKEKKYLSNLLAGTSYKCV